MLCLRFGGSIVAMLFIAVIAVLAVLVGVSLGYWIRNLSLRTEISVLTQNSGNLTTQLAQRENQLELARKEASTLGVENARLGERLTAEQE